MLQCDPRNRSTYHSGQLKITQRFHNGLQFLGSYTYGKALDYGGSAASGGGAVGNPQTVTNLQPATARQASTSAIARSSAGSTSFRSAPGRQWLSNGGVLGAIAGGWQLAGIATLTTGRPFTVFMQTGVNNGAPSWPNRIGSGKLDNPTVDLWYNPADFVAPPAIPTATAAAASSTRPATSTSTRRCRSGSPIFGREQYRIPVGRVQSVQSSGLRLPEPELRFANGRSNHVDNRRQQVDAVLVEIQFLTPGLGNAECRVLNAEST